jgi:hypothetical protein
MLKGYLFLSAFVFLGMIDSTAQNTGMLPISSMRYFKEGLWAKSINTKMNGLQLMSNRIPPNNEIEINLLDLTGFTADKKKNIFPAASYCILSVKRDTLQQVKNILLEHEGIGFSPKDLLKGLSLKFSVKEGLIQPNSKGIVSLLLYDQKGKNKLRLEYPVNIAYPRENIYQIATAPVLLKSPPGTTAMAFGLTSKDIQFTIDTAVSYNPKMVYLHLEVTKLGGVDVISLLQGKETYWVYDTTYKEINIKDKVLKDAGGAMGTASVNCTIKIPFRLKTEIPRPYYIRYRWDGSDKTQALDIIMPVK